MDKMKKGLLLILSVAFIVVLSACGGPKSVNLLDYVEVSFEGMDTDGRAYYYVDEYNAVVERSGFNPEKFEEEMIKLVDKNPGKAADINALYSAYTLSIDSEENLSNGDKVIVTVTVGDDAKGIKGGEKEFTVEGLEEPEVLTMEEVKKHVIVDFVGANERGNARIQNTLPGELSYIDFTVENDGALSNGDTAKLIIDEEYNSLIDYGYKLEEGFEATYDVKDLQYFAKTADEIANLTDIKRMIGEEVNKRYQKESDWNFDYVYDVKEEVMLYRQFDDEDSYYDGEGHGSFVVLYSITEYNNTAAKKDKDPSQTFIAMEGYRYIELNEDGKANVSKIITQRQSEDNSYSLETVQQIYEGNGYEVVKEIEKKKK